MDAPLTLSLTPIPIGPGTRRLILVLLGISFANYVIHLFPISFIRFFEFYPASVAAQVQTGVSAEIQSRVWHAIAWLEFLIVIIFQVFLIIILTVFIIVREIARWIARGRDALAVTGFGYMCLLTMPFVEAYVVSVMLTEGMEGFAGSRIGGLPLPVLMFFVAVIGGMSLGLAVGYTAEPGNMQRHLSEAHRGKYANPAE